MSVHHLPGDEGYEHDPDPFEEDLDGFLIEVAPDDSVPDAEVADRLLARVRRLERQADAVRELVRSRVAAVHVWRDERLAVIDGERARVEGLLEGWARAVHADTRQVTWKLPAGTITLRPARDRVRVNDAHDDTAAAMLLEAGHDRFVDVTTVRSVPKARVSAEARPGDVTACDWASAEPGYELRAAVIDVPDEATGELYEVVLPGVLFETRDERVFKAAPR